MELSHFTFLLFTLFSSLRIFSYLPQIRKVARDPNGASAISYSTWTLWTGANIATAAYPSINLHDHYLASVSALYAVSCMTVILLTLLKRRNGPPGPARRMQNRAPAQQAAAKPGARERAVPAGELQACVRRAGAALVAGARPPPDFEREVSCHIRRMLWCDARGMLAQLRWSVRGRHGAAIPARGAGTLP